MSVTPAVVKTVNNLMKNWHNSKFLGFLIFHWLTTAGKKQQKQAKVHNITFVLISTENLKNAQKFTKTGLQDVVETLQKGMKVLTVDYIFSRRKRGSLKCVNKDLARTNFVSTIL